MKEDTRMCKSLNCDGIVTGILTREGKVDRIRCAELVALASPMQVAFHRAFDMADDMVEALEDIISLGMVRILTSGGKASALEGAEMLAKLISIADGRISIMPGAGISTDNISQIITLTGAKVFHASARLPVSSEMTYRNEQLNMGADTDEYTTTLTNAELVKKLLELANSAE
jgi:copper homeostasis protein